MSANSLNLDNVMPMKPAPRWSTACVIRLLACLLIAAAIVAQATRSIGGAISRNGDVATTGINFFSFFTVLSNLGSVVVLAIVGVFPRLVADRLSWRSVLGILVFPLLWVAYTLIRGPLVTNPTTGAAWWYP